MECYFSVNERMLGTKRGREYARQIPLDKLLIETNARENLDPQQRQTSLSTSYREHSKHWPIFETNAKSF